MRRKHAAAEPSRVGYAACATWVIEDDNHDHGYTRLGEHSSGNSVKVTLDRLEAMLKPRASQSLRESTMPPAPRPSACQFGRAGC